MVQTCTKCSRPNPPDALYCYFDGFVLNGQGRHGGPLAVGSQPFNAPFVFPTGRRCGSFDELALACQEEWATARDLLRQGFFASFFGGLGRADLAMTAREAAKYPDPDRGLDQLLSKLPSDILTPPTLKAEPSEINLGVLTTSTDRSFKLHLENQGMRLLHGTVSCPGVAWLTFGDTPGVSERHFQFQHEQALPVRVCGDRLRAGNKPQEAKLIVQSNGGTTTVVVRAEVPVKPYPSGLLAGAKSPREVAAKAKANPKEAAPIFERGEVAEWYKSNGWTYPVQGPAASGLGAIQQFFEALGLVPAPKVEVSTRAITLTGTPGEPLSYQVEVKTAEKKYVYASGSSDESWLRVGKPKFKGATATIPVSIPSVPNAPGRTLTARLTIQANGNQRFVVPVTVQVNEGFDFGGGAPLLDVVEPLAVVSPEPVAASPAVGSPVAVAPVPVRPAIVSPVAVASAPAPALGANPFGVVEPSPLVARHRRSRDSASSVPFWVHTLPALFLVAAVLGVVGFDLLNPLKAHPDGGGQVEDDTSGPWEKPETLGPQVLWVQHRDTDERFGIKVKNPNPNDTQNKYKLLTSRENGAGNNTVVRIDGEDYIFGTPGNPNQKWIRKEKKTANGRGWVSEIEFRRQRVYVTQHVEVVTGKSGKLDTCLIFYSVENRSNVPREVGLRIMIDTLIGTNDGVPFLVPGESEFLTTKRDFQPAAEVPPYLEAVEKPDNVKESGIVARLGLKNIALKDVKLDPVDRVVVTHYQGGGGSSEKRWDLDFEDIAEDSCVAVYWNPKVLEPRDDKDPDQKRGDYARDLAITYGLGELAITETTVSQNGALAFSDPGPVPANGEFTLSAYVYNATADQRVKLDLPGNGLTLAPGESAVQAVPKAGKRVLVKWRLRAGAAGKYKVEASSGSIKTDPFDIVVKSLSIVG
jgi:hypothetical protein